MTNPQWLRAFLTSVALFLVTQPCRAVQLCYDYAIYRLTGTDPRPPGHPSPYGSNSEDLMAALKDKHYRIVTPRPTGRELKPDDVILIAGHVGYVTAPDAIDHFVQVEGTARFSKKYPPEELPSSPVDAKGNSLRGGLFLGDPLETFMKRPFSPPATYDVYRQSRDTPRKGEMKKFGPYTVTPGKWQPTGLSIRKGQTFKVEASGKWRFTAPPNIEFGPEGGGVWGWFVLKGKIGDALFDVGSHGEASSSQAGMLELGAPATSKMGHSDEAGLAGEFTVYVFTDENTPVLEGGDTPSPSRPAPRTPSSPRSGEIEGSYAGRWNTIEWGTIDLRETDGEDRLEGTYSCCNGGGKITAVIRDGRVYFSWKAADGHRGEGILHFYNNASRLEGFWCDGAGCDASGQHGFGGNRL